MRLHKIDVSKKSIHIDGIPFTIDREAEYSEYQRGLYGLRCTILCDEINVHGDTYATNETTPIYDQLVAEMGEQ